jgi:hypothetical protein
MSGLFGGGVGPAEMADAQDQRGEPANDQKGQHPVPVQGAGRLAIRTVDDADAVDCPPDEGGAEKHDGKQEAEATDENSSQLQTNTVRAQAHATPADECVLVYLEKPRNRYSRAATTPSMRTTPTTRFR